ncbi:MAG: hypothetical protein ACRCZ9_11545 [Fusobacteriaceae bacterium]
MKKIILIFSLTVILAACTKENKAVKESIIKANSLVTTKEFLTAQDILSTAILRYPKEKSTLDAKIFLEQINEMIAKDELERQEKKLAEAEKLFENKNYSETKKIIESLVSINPNSKIASKGKSIFEKILILEFTEKFYEFYKEKKYFSARLLLDDFNLSNSIKDEFLEKLNVEINKELFVLETKFKTEYDKWQDVSFVQHKLARKYRDDGNFVELYFSKTSVLNPRIKFNYNGESWVFFDKILIKIDDYPTKSINIKSKYRNTHYGGVSEIADVYLFTDNFLKEIPFTLIQEMAYGNSVEVRFTGDKSSTAKLSTNDKKALKDALNYYLLTIAKDKFSVGMKLLKEQKFKSKTL